MPHRNRDLPRVQCCLFASGILFLCTQGSLPAQEPLYTFDGELEGDLFGRAVASVDLDQDGKPEMVMSSRADSSGSQPGHVYVYSGIDGNLLLSLEGETPSDRFGVAIADAGDVDDDGTNDLLVGAWKFSSDGVTPDNAGKAYVYSGATGLLLRSWIGMPGDNLGHALSAAGDIDHDGFSDVIVGAWGHAAPLPYTGACYVYSGFDGSLLIDLYGEAENDHFGKAVASAGDVDQDWTDDVLVGAWFHDSGLVDSGRAYVYSGDDEALLYTLDGITLYESFGAIVAGSGDLDLDGYSDFMISGVLGGATGAGRVCVYSGQQGSLLYEWFGDAPVDYFGSSIAFGEDVNRDGVEDLLIGATGFLKPDTSPGWAYIYSGRDGAFLSRFEGEAFADRLGVSASGAGDLNDDGCADAMFGAYLHDSVANNAGRAYVFAGNDLFFGGSESVMPGDVLRLEVTGGIQGLPVFMFVWSVNGSPVTLFIGSGFFDAQGSFLKTANVPPTVTGITIGLKSFARVYAGTADSNEWLVTFL